VQDVFLLSLLVTIVSYNKKHGFFLHYLDNTFFFIFLRPMKHNKQKIFFLTLALFFTVSALFAIEGGDGPPPPTPPPGLPLDGGVLALLVAGFFYGIKKSLKKK